MIVPDPPIDEATELDFNANTPQFSNFELQNMRIQARVYRRALLRDASEEFRRIVENLDACSVIELYHGREDQKMLASWLELRHRIAERKEKSIELEETQDDLISECLARHEETEPANEPLKKSAPVAVALLDENSREVHKAAAEFLKRLLTEDPRRLTYEVEV
jgi:hypothetical protein